MTVPPHTLRLFLFPMGPGEPSGILLRRGPDNFLLRYGEGLLLAVDLDRLLLEAAATAAYVETPALPGAPETAN